MEKYGVDPDELTAETRGYEDIAVADCYKDIAEATRKKKRPKRDEAAEAEHQKEK